MKILDREQEVLATAPTGMAARLIQGNTIHTGLDGDNANGERHSELDHCGQTRPC